MASRPRTETCFICGREYGRSSIAIHTKQCAKLWEQTEAKKPRGQRRPLPQPPKAVTKEDVIAANIRNGGDGVNISSDDHFMAKKQVASDHFNDTALVKCEHCSRTFLPERFAIHARSCLPGSTSKSAVESKRKTVDTGRADGRIAALDPEKVEKYRSPIRLSNAGGIPVSVDERIECPKCNRRFAPDAAQRHIPTCCAKPMKRRPSELSPAQPVEQSPQRSNPKKTDDRATPNRTTPRSMRKSVEQARGAADSFCSPGAGQDLNPYSSVNYYSAPAAPVPSAATMALIDKIETRVETLTSELAGVKTLLAQLKTSLLAGQ